MNAIASPPRTRNRDGQPWLKLLASGIWQICHSPGNGTTTRLSTKTKDESEARVLLERYRLSLEGKQGTELLTVGEVFDYYLESHVEEKANDVERRKVALAWLRASLGDRRISSLTSDDMQRYIKARSNGTAPVYEGRKTLKPVGPASSGTLRYELAAMVTAFKFASLRKRTSGFTLPHFDLPDAPEPTDVWLNEAEHDWLLQFVAWEDESGRMSRIWRFVALALGTAARKSAIIDLQWSAVDIDARRVFFQQGSQRAGAQRSRKRAVPVPIPEWLVPLLQRAHSERTGDYVLDEPVEPTGAFDTLKRRAFKATQNPKYCNLTPHALRHTTATLMARAGVPIINIAAILGNSVEVCSRRYLHHCPDHLRHAVNYRTISTDTESLL